MSRLVVWTILRALRTPPQKKGTFGTKHTWNTKIHKENSPTCTNATKIIVSCFCVFSIHNYCWWKKSCTTGDVWDHRDGTKNKRTLRTRASMATLESQEVVSIRRSSDFGGESFGYVFLCCAQICNTIDILHVYWIYDIYIYMSHGQNKRRPI